MFSLSANGISELSTDIVLTVFLALFTVITVFVGTWFIAANINKPEKDKLGKLKPLTVLCTVIIIGFVIRVLFSLVTVGYLGLDTQHPSSSTGGLLEIYKSVHSALLGTTPTDGYVVPTYINMLFGKVLDIFGGFNQDPNIIMRLVFRLPYMLCDIAAAVVLYRIAKKYANRAVGIGLAAIYSLCPVFFLASGIWGSTTSILALLILLSLYFITQKNFLGLTAAYGLALLTSKEAAYLLPIFGVFYGYHLIKSFKANRDAKPMTMRQRFMDKECGIILRIPVYLVVAFLVAYLINMPMLSAINYSFFKWIHLIFILPFSKIEVFGTNSFSIYNLFGRNNAVIGENNMLWLITLGFMTIASVLVGVLYASKKNRANMVIVSLYAFTTLTIYALGFSELSLLIVLSGLLFAFAIIKDKRILHIFGLLAFIVVLNASTVMMEAGYFANLDIDEFARNINKGTALLSGSTVGNVINIICSVMAILTHLYFTLVVLDISMTNRRMLFAPADDSFGASIKNWFSSKN